MQQVWLVHTLLLVVGRREKPSLAKPRHHYWPTLEKVVGPGSLGTMRKTETWT